MAVDAVHQLQHVVIFSHGDLRKQIITAMLVMMKAMFLMLMTSVGRSVMVEAEDMKCGSRRSITGTRMVVAIMVLMMYDGSSAHVCL